MLDEVFAESIGVSNKVSKGSRSVGTSLFFSVSEEFHKQGYTWLEVLVKNIVVEASVSNSEACKLPCVSIRVLTALDRGCDETELEKLLVEESCMSA